MVMAAGTLSGVGVGPGDPELVTVKAMRLIARAPVIAYLAAAGRESTALAIARPYVPDSARHIVIDMPMLTERRPGEKAYDAGAAAIAAQLDQGQDVVMLCEGDPFFYGSFMYVFARLSPRYRCTVVPGITSMTASAAALGQPLSARDEVVKVLPATLEEGRLREELATASNAAIIKVGRHFAKVRGILEALELSHRAHVVIRATHADQRVAPLADVSEEQLPYFSTILVFAGARPW
jgi:precorrin-2/cobalt-factor-2 C20-methyltransferase